MWVWLSAPIYVYRVVLWELHRCQKWYLTFSISDSLNDICRFCVRSSFIFSRNSGGKKLIILARNDGRRLASWVLKLLLLVDSRKSWSVTNSWNMTRPRAVICRLSGRTTGRICLVDGVSAKRDGFYCVSINWNWFMTS